VKNRIDPAVERAVLDFAFEQPAYGQLRVSNELRKRSAGLAVDGKPQPAHQQPLFPTKLHISSSSAASTCFHRTISASTALAPAIYQRLTLLVVFSVFLKRR